MSQICTENAFHVFVSLRQKSSISRPDWAIQRNSGREGGRKKERAREQEGGKRRKREGESTGGRKAGEKEAFQILYTLTYSGG